MLGDHAAQIRSRFPIFRHKIYLNSCSQGALSEAVEHGFREYVESWHKHGSPWDIWVEEYERVRGVFADFIGATSDEVAIVTSASAAINAVASCLDFRQRPKIVMGEFEFPTMGHVWLAQRPRGADVQFVPAHGEQIDRESYARTVDRKTALVPITHVCFKNGFRSPVREILPIAKQHGALVMLDDYQDAGTRPIDVKNLGVDFYVTGTLKYLLGPPGLAFMYVRRELVGSLTPTVTGWFGQANPFAFDARKFDPSPTARRFESGSPPVPNLYGAAPGLELLRSIGLMRVASQVQQLTQALLQGAAPPHKDDVDLLSRACKDRREKVEVRQAAARSLGRLGVEAKSAVPTLLGLLKESSDELRGAALNAVSAIGPEARDAQALADVLKAPSADVRRMAMQALARLGPEAKLAVPAVAGALKDASKATRVQAAMTLEAIGPAAKDAAPALTEALKDAEPEVGLSAARALVRLGEGKTAIPYFIEVLKGSNQELRRTAIAALAQFGPESKGAAGQLVRALDDDALRSEAAEALVKIGKAAVPAVAKKIHMPSPAVRMARIEILRRIGTAERLGQPYLNQALAALGTLLRDPERDNRRAAQEAGVEIQRKNSKS